MSATFGQAVAGVQPDSLVYPREKTLFRISAVISIIFWILLVVGTLGIALVYLLFAFLIYLFAQSGLLSYLRGNAARITAAQFPDLHERVQKCCAQLDVANPPDAFLLHAGGVFNAFAARFLGRNFIVLYSDVVDALEASPEALNFYIGHELGHIRRNHLGWGPVLFPAGLLPLLGAAYSRAREYTCDLHGLACCPSPEVAARALAALAAGAHRWRSIDLEQAAAETASTAGFWMSFHELVAGYPWLTKRIARVLGPQSAARIPARHPLAWLLALFVPRIGAGGAGGAMVTIAIVGILAAVAIPAYQDYTMRAKVAVVLQDGSLASAAVTDYFNRNGNVPASLEAAGIAQPPPEHGVRSMSVDQKGVIRIELNFAPVEGKAIALIPSLDANKRVIWRCVGQDVPPRFLPQSCK
jgi:Zn-dependent protease with chaperone function